METVWDAGQRYGVLAEQLPLVVYVSSLERWDPPLYVSPQIEQLTGFSPEEWTSEREVSRSRVHPVDRPRVEQEELERRTTTDDSFTSEYRFIHRDGRTVWVRDESVVARGDSGEALHIQGFLIDITDRRQAEERYRELVEHLPITMYVAPIQGHRPASYISPKNEELTGYRPEEWVADPQLFARIIHPDDRERVYRELEAANASGAPFVSEYRIVRRTGDVRWVREESVPVGDEGDRRALGFLLDVTEQKNAVAERKRLEEQFAQAEKMEAIGRLAGGVAHDFNNLLLAIRGYTDLALQDVSDSDGTARRSIEQIRNAAERAASITSELLAFSRKQVLLPRAVDLNVLVFELRDMLERVTGEGVELVLDLAGGLGPVRVDPVQMERGIVNLAINAADAMKGQGRLTIATARLAGDDPWISLSVSDTGAGMDESTRERIFEPFFTTKDGGTGLGLSTVYGFVEQSDGSLTVESAPERGTTFTLSFPEVSPSPFCDTPEPAPADHTGTETILVVEDEDSVREMLVEALNRFGYRALAASDGDDALERFHEDPERIDVLVTDVVMPRRGGVETAEELKQSRPGLRVIFMSGHVRDLQAFGAQAEGVFMQKPFAPADLAQTIRRVLA
jgi:two-component system, cell cycle sensor histidine kinase and response regulator CckA